MFRGCRALIDLGVNVDAQCDQLKTPLHIVVLAHCLGVRDCSELVDLLIQGGANLGIRDNTNQTPYELAVFRNCYDLLDLLKPTIQGIPRPTVPMSGGPDEVGPRCECALL